MANYRLSKVVHPEPMSVSSCGKGVFEDVLKDLEVRSSRVHWVSPELKEKEENAE